MRYLGTSSWRAAAVAGVLAAIATVPLPAENIDPANDKSQYAWAENVGWINAEPSGDGGPGVQVDDFELTGWMWGENVGWISLSCKNTSVCDATPYGVTNDGAGSLSGEAWAENAGWLRFDPSYGGVTVDVVDGAFSGRAWAENLGWVTFASSGPVTYGVRTSWNCSPPPTPPSGIPETHVERTAGRTRLVWASVVSATGYDVVRGDLDDLRTTAGDYTTATDACDGENVTDTSMVLEGEPAAGNGFWYLVRAANCGGTGSYDSGGSGQAGSRDAETGLSGNDCAVP